MRFFMSLIVLITTASAAQAQTAGPQGEPRGGLREQVFLVPFAPDVGAGDQLMHTIVFRPRGDGPFPLAVINHGSPREASDRAKMTARFGAASSWFVERGYAVAVPTRRGYGPTGGGWMEDQGRCSSPDYYNAGLRTSQDIRSAVLYFREQRFVDASRIVVVGQSAGGWGTLASAGQKFPGVVAFVNFAGGRGSRGSDDVCTPYALVQAAKRYGSGVDVPVLSLYTVNDKYFNPSLAKQMFDAFVEGGATKARFLQLPAFGEDGHEMFGNRDSPPVWGPHVEAFLREVVPAR